MCNINVMFMCSEHFVYFVHTQRQEKYKTVELGLVAIPPGFNNSIVVDRNKVFTLLIFIIVFKLFFLTFEFVRSTITTPTLHSVNMADSRTWNE